MPEYREGLGDETERYIRHEHGYIEYRYAPGGTCEIVNIEVARTHRRQGVGRKLIEMLCSEIEGKAERIYAITRASNAAARQFYERTQFNAAGDLRKLYYPERTGDAVMYVRGRKGPV